MLWTTTATATERTTVADGPTRSRTPCEHRRIGSGLSPIRRHGGTGKSKIVRALRLGRKSSQMMSAEDPVDLRLVVSPSRVAAADPSERLRCGTAVHNNTKGSNIVTMVCVAGSVAPGSTTPVRFVFVRACTTHPRAMRGGSRISETAR
jgi:hypothetical protein